MQESQGFLIFGVKYKVPCTTHQDIRSPSPPASCRNMAENVGIFLSISAILTPYGPKGRLNLESQGFIILGVKNKVPLYHSLRYQVSQPPASCRNMAENVGIFLQISAILTFYGPKGWLNQRVPGVSHFRVKEQGPPASLIKILGLLAPRLMQKYT